MTPGLEHAVLCTHGEAMRPLLRSIDLDHLRRQRPAERPSPPADEGLGVAAPRVDPRGKVVELLHVVPDA